MSFAAGSHRDFGRWDFCFSARILARFAAGSWRDFGRRDFCFPARILARFKERSRRDFGRREFHFPATILPGSRRDFRREEKSRRPKSRRDRDSRRDFGGIPPRSRSLFYKVHHYNNSIVIIIINCPLHIDSQYISFLLSTVFFFSPVVPTTSPTPTTVPLINQTCIDNPCNNGTCVEESYLGNKFRCECPYPTVGPVCKSGEL